MKVRYNKHNLAVARVAAKAGTPEHTSVDFTPEYTMATDGFRLAKVTVPKKEGALHDIVHPLEISPSHVLVPREVVKNIKLPKWNKDLIGTDAVYITNRSADEVTLTTYDAETGSKKNTEAKEVPGNSLLFDGEVLQEAIDGRGRTVSVNVEGLIELLKMAKDLSHHVEIKVPEKKGRAILITAKGGDDQILQALIMPLNKD